MSAGIDYKLLYEQSQLRITLLEQQLPQLQKMIFGSRHERFVPSDASSSQLALDIKADPVAVCNISNAQKISYTRATVAVESTPLQHPGRMKLPDSLRREQIILEPAEDLSGCKKIGEELTEVLEYQPGELFVKQYTRPKHARPGGNGVTIATLPSRPLEKAMAGEALLTQIIIDKYIDHLPLHRQTQRFERAGIKLAYSTLTDWVSGTCHLITPLFEALKKEVLKSSYLHVDETPIKVLDKHKKGETHRGYYWVYQDSLHKRVLFNYQEGRGREGPTEILKDFTGYLQTDGYVAYEVFGKRPGIELIHCMAHARRMFNDALDNDEARATHALREIQQLYTIERICREQQLNAAETAAMRQQKAIPILGELRSWLQQQYGTVLPKSAIGKAVAYSLERWDRLSAYTKDGRLKIDNNPVENSIRPVAPGRKNYLFAGSHDAARRSGMLCSLLGTCKMHGVEPYASLKQTLQGRQTAIKIDGGDVTNTIEYIKNVWESFVPANPFEYYFLDEQIDSLYKTEAVLSNILSILSTLIILVVTIGLIGLTMLTVEQRTKEIGIRKVIGASPFDLLYLLSKEYIKRVIISFLIAVPVTWFVMKKWMREFAYHISLDAWVFLAVGTGALIIAILIVWVQSISAVKANLARTLRTD